MNDILKNRNFQVWKYIVSHGYLLIRSPKNSSEGISNNIDIKFYGVEYIQIKRFIRSLFIDFPNAEEIKEICALMKKEISPDRIFIFVSDSERFIIVAERMIIDTNNKDIFDD